MICGCCGASITHTGGCIECASTIWCSCGLKYCGTHGKGKDWAEHQKDCPNLTIVVKIGGGWSPTAEVVIPTVLY